MVTFDELKINKEADVLVVTAHVKDEAYYNNVYIDKVYVNTEETYVEGNPAENPVYTYTAPVAWDADVNQDGEINAQDLEALQAHLSGEAQYENADVNKDGVVNSSDVMAMSELVNGRETGGIKEISLNIDGNDILADLGTHLFFVSVVTKGTPSPDTPCGMDNQITTGVTLSLCSYYSSLLNYLKELGDTCNVPMGLVDQLLKWEALNISIATGHYTKSIEYFNKWFSGKSVTTPSTCGCNGR